MVVDYPLRNLYATQVGESVSPASARGLFSLSSSPAMPAKLCSAELLPGRPLLRWLLFSLGPSTPLWFLGFIYPFSAFYVSVSFVGLLFILPNIFLIFWVFCFPLLFSLPLPYTLHPVFYRQIHLHLMHLSNYLWYPIGLLYCPYFVLSYNDINLEGMLCFLSIGKHLKNG